MTNIQETNQQAAADNKARREAREADQKRVEGDITKAREEQIKRNMDKMQADSKLRPTPTIEEVQLAMAGKNPDIKEPDGSPEQNPHHHVAGPAAQIEVGRELPKAESASPADDNVKAGDPKPLKAGETKK